MKTRRWTQHNGFSPLRETLRDLPMNHAARQQYESMLSLLDKQAARELLHLSIGLSLGVAAGALFVITLYSHS